jgi:hypothetical protein
MAAELLLLAAIANASKATGAVVTLEPDEFRKILDRVKAPLVIYATGGILRTNHQYSIAYKGFVFFTKSSTMIDLPSDAEVIAASSISVPSL